MASVSCTNFNLMFLMLIIIISGNNHRYTVIVLHITGPQAIPQRSVSESGTGSEGSESRGPVPDPETLRNRFRAYFHHFGTMTHTPGIGNFSA